MAWRSNSNGSDAGDLEDPGSNTGYGVGVMPGGGGNNVGGAAAGGASQTTLPGQPTHGSSGTSGSSGGMYNPIGDNPGSTDPSTGAGTGAPPADGSGTGSGEGTGAGGSQGNNQTFGTVAEGPQYGVATKVTAGRQGSMDGSWVPAQNEAQNQSPYTSGLWDIQANSSPGQTVDPGAPAPGSVPTGFAPPGAPTGLQSGPGPGGFLGGVIGSYFK